MRPETAATGGAFSSRGRYTSVAKVVFRCGGGGVTPGDAGLIGFAGVAAMGGGGGVTAACSCLIRGAGNSCDAKICGGGELCGGRGAAVLASSERESVRCSYRF